MTITAAQIKAARILLGWSQIKLAIESDVGSGVIASFEKGPRVPQGASVDRLVRALKAAGVTFSGSGKPSVKQRKWM